MAEPGRVFEHAQAAGCASLADYVLELEDILEAIAEANTRPDEPEDMYAALMRARELVESWDIRP